MTRDNGGPAFPRPLSNGVLIDHAGKSSQVDVLPQCGMSLRDYFAGQALSCLNYHNILALSFTNSECAHQIQNAVALSYRLADAMIAERSKP